MKLTFDVSYSLNKRFNMFMIARHGTNYGIKQQLLVDALTQYLDREEGKLDSPAQEEEKTIKRMTPERIEQARLLRSQGKTMDEIATALDTTAATISRTLKKVK